MSSITKHNRKDGRESHRIYYHDHIGERRSRIIIGDKQKAQDILYRLEIEVQDIKNGIKPPPVRKEYVAKLVGTYLKNLRRSGKKESTVKRYTTSLRTVVNYFSEDKSISDVSYSDIEKYKAFRLETCTPAGVNIDLRHLRAFLNYCVRMEYITKSPYTGVKQVKVRLRDVRSLSTSELGLLFQAITLADDADVMDILLFYLHTGARAKEILPPLFTWDSIKDDYIELSGKGDKTRQVGLNDTTRDILQRRRHLPAPFPYKYEYVYSRIVRKYYKRVGIKDTGLHSLRKTAGALLVQSGISIYGVSKFLGHSSVTVTERHYADLVQRNYAEMSEALDKAIPRVSEPSTRLQWQLAS